MVLTRSRKASSKQEAAAPTRSKTVKPSIKAARANLPRDKPQPGSPDFIQLEPAPKSNYGSRRSKTTSAPQVRVRFESDLKTKADSKTNPTSVLKPKATPKIDGMKTTDTKAKKQGAKTFMDLAKSMSYDIEGWQSISYPGDRYLQALQRLTSIASSAAGKMRYELDREVWIHENQDGRNIARLQMVNQCFGRIAIAAQIQLAICEYLSRDKCEDWGVEMTRSARAEGVLKTVESLMDDIQISRTGNDMGAPMFRQILQHIRADDKSIKFRQDPIKLQAQSENTSGSVGSTHIGTKQGPNLNRDWDGVFRLSGIEGGLSGGAMSSLGPQRKGSLHRIVLPSDSLDNSEPHLDSGVSRVGGKNALRPLGDDAHPLGPFTQTSASGKKVDINNAAKEAGTKKRKRQANARPDAAYGAGYESDEQLVALMEVVEDESRQPPKRSKRALPRHKAIALANAKITEKLQVMTEKQAADAQAALIEESRRKVAGLKPLAQNSGQQRMMKKHPATKRSKKS